MSEDLGWTDAVAGARESASDARGGWRLKEEFDDDTEEIVLDRCDVCGDNGIFGLCPACAHLAAKLKLLRGRRWTRGDLLDWLQDKGLNPVGHVTSGLLGVRGTFLHYASGRGVWWEAFPSMFQPLTEYRP